MKRAVFASMFVLSMAATSAMAAPVLVDFDFNGGGGPGVAVSSFDWLPGNSIIIPTGGNNFNILYQANLGILQGAGLANGTQTGGNWFTAVAGFGVTAISAEDFALNPLAPSFFKIYVDGEAGNDLLGTGFTDGTEILSGTATSTLFSSNFTVNSADAGALDQAATIASPGNSYAGVNTVGGSGGTTVNVVIDSFDSNYFLNFLTLPLGTTMSFTSTSQTLPYRDVDPSAAFSSNGVADGDVAGVSSLGGFNGIPGNNVMAQADASSNFDVTPVPEPASLLLLGVGILGVAAAARRRKANQVR